MDVFIVNAVIISFLASGHGSKICDTNNQEDMAYMRMKWTYSLNIFDQDKDDEVSNDDRDIIADNFDKFGLGSKKGKFQTWWNAYIGRGKDSMTTKAFIDRYERDYKAYQNYFGTGMKPSIDKIFNMFDFDNMEEQFTYAEFENAHKIINLPTDNVQNEFNDFKLVDVIETKVLTDKWLQFFSDCDKLQEDRILQIYQKYD